MPTAALILELFTLFLLLPIAFRYLPIHISPLPVLWIATLYCYLTLRHDPTFPTANLWNAQALPSQLRSSLIIFAIVGSIIAACVYRFTPKLLFSLVRTRPGTWAVVMLLYPILSVYPQSIVYRAFLMHRYTSLIPIHLTLPIIGDLVPILLSASAFAFMHIVFRNPLAIYLTFLGGLLFAWRYQTTNSIAASSLDHALYGCLMFTIGLGEYFYHRRIKL